MENKQKLRRLSSNKVVAGVCSGIANYFGLSTSGTRIAFIILMLFAGLSIWVYIGMWIIIPKE